MKCKQCGYTIILSSTYADQLAHENGFCSASCEQSHRRFKEMTLDDLRRTA